MNERLLRVKILRQDKPDSVPYWENFLTPANENATVQDVLSEIQKAPVNAEGKAVSPVIWECNCIEEVCGACAMNICQRPGLACGTLVSNVLKSPDMPLTIAPLTKFPVLRDLVVDRTKIYETYMRFRLYAAAENIEASAAQWEEIYPFTRCASCGICAEICPNVDKNSRFTGAAGIALARVIMECGADTRGLMEKDGIAGCGGHSLCSGICPKNIDLTAAIASLNKNIRFCRILTDVLT